MDSFYRQCRRHYSPIIPNADYCLRIKVSYYSAYYPTILLLSNYNQNATVLTREIRWELADLIYRIVSVNTSLFSTHTDTHTDQQMDVCV